METESSHSVGGTSNFIALFQRIYTILVGNILSRSCTKSVTVYCNILQNQGIIIKEVTHLQKENKVFKRGGGGIIG